jgi:cysteine desulfurase / selenocysteine lyase
MSIDWKQVRTEFPALEHWTYLNTATYGQMPRCANQAMLDHLAHRDELACSDYLSWFDDADRMRESIGRLIHCWPEDVAFVSTASTALGLLLGGLDWRDGDRIVTLEGEFPNNLYAPHFAGAGVEFVETPWERFYDAITPRTRLVLLSMLNYASGFRPPLEEISAYLRERGTLLYVDGTQGVGAVRMDVQSIRPSMLAVHGYKWMLSPTGAGFMYASPELRERLQPNVVGWRSDKRWREVDNLHHGKPEFKDSAEKYEGGMIPFALLYAMEASVGLMLELGPENIEDRVLGLADTLRARLRDGGAEVGDAATPIVSARLRGRDVSAVARRLKQRRIEVSARHGFLRISPHFYNDESDIDRFMDALNGPG